MKNPQPTGGAEYCRHFRLESDRRLERLPPPDLSGRQCRLERNQYLCHGTAFRDQNLTTDQAIQEYYRRNFPDPHWRPLQELLKLSDEVIKELLYTEDFASRKMYFRRLRVPPLVNVYWRHIVANHFMRKFMRCYVSDGKRAVKQGFAALKKIKRMKELAEPLGLPVDDIRFQYDTFRIIATVREYYFLDFTEELEERLRQMKVEYEEKYDEPRYTLMLDTSRFKLRRSTLRLMLKMMFRGEHGYRLF